MQQLISDLLAANIGDIRTNERLAPYKTWKIGLVESRQGGGMYVKATMFRTIKDSRKLWLDNGYE